MEGKMNRRGISAMHDAIFFIVMVSLSGAILLPAFINNPITKSEIERERSETADETLIVLLSVTPKEFNYRLANETLKDVLGYGGIINTKDGLGKAIFDWLLGIKQYHKCYGELIAEDLASQFLLKWNGNHKLNIIVGNFDENLKKNISKELDKILERRYKFNFTAKWEPIIGLPFGGKICVGMPPPETAYVSKTFVTMPFAPVITIDGKEMHLNKNWMKERIEKAGAIGNISKLISKIPSADAEWNKLEEQIEENLTNLIYGFLFNGIETENGVFPGILNIALHLVLEKIIEYIEKSETFNSFVSSLNNIFKDGMDVMEYLINLTLTHIYEMVEGHDKLEGSIKEKINKIIDSVIIYVLNSLENSEFGNALKEYISNFVDFIIEKLKESGEVINEVKNMIDDWLFNRISISRAEVSLAIWEA